MLAAHQESKNHLIAKDGEIRKADIFLRIIRLVLLVLFFFFRQKVK